MAIVNNYYLKWSSHSLKLTPHTSISLIVKEQLVDKVSMFVSMFNPSLLLGILYPKRFLYDYHAYKPFNGPSSSKIKSKVPKVGPKVSSH